MSYTPPEETFKELFVDLQFSKVLEDDKQISDAIPRSKPEHILRAYREQKDQKGFDLKSFFEAHFELTETPTTAYKADANRPIEEHIKSLWTFLKRDADKLVNGSSLIPIHYPYIVPGGRFNEIYYWDSFFTMLGLKVHGEVEVIENMLKNFAWFIDHLGFIPNGNRTYFLGRSQPPFFSLMVDLLADLKGDEVLVEYLPQLQKEYDFWMDKDAEKESHLIHYKGVQLNRYCDKYEGPRPEMYATDYNDFKTFKEPNNYFKHLRAACESGWDFSSRWLKDPMNLGSIQTLDILPVDLNSLLVFLEELIAKGYAIKGETEQSEEFKQKADDRKKCIQQMFWNENQGYFGDLNFKEEEFTGIRSLAGLFPLYFNIASKEQAASCAKAIEEHFLKEGGLVSTPLITGQQWDAPNGWAPLQYMSVIGLKNYGFDNLANQIMDRWIKCNETIYKKTAKMLEKYNVETIEELSGGGEYLVQDGFGWTNGVYLAFKEMQKS